jgi:hypothetical protein
VLNVGVNLGLMLVGTVKAMRLSYKRTFVPWLRKKCPKKKAAVADLSLTKKALVLDMNSPERDPDNTSP